MDDTSTEPSALTDFKNTMLRFAHVLQLLQNNVKLAFAELQIEINLAEERLAEFRAGKLQGDQEIDQFVHDSQESVKRARTASDLVDEMEWSVLEWTPVMLVTFTEAYLQNVLSYLASVNSELMERSESSAKYSEILVAQSIESLAAELRSKWARRFVDDGGPSSWIKKLQKLGARYQNADLENAMEQLWGTSSRSGPRRRLCKS